MPCWGTGLGTGIGDPQHAHIKLFRAGSCHSGPLNFDQIFNNVFHVFGYNFLNFCPFVASQSPQQCRLCDANKKESVGCFSRGLGIPGTHWMSKNVNGEMFSNFRIVSTLHANWIQKWTFLQKLKTQNWSSIKILHYRPLQHADRPKLRKLWQKCHWRKFWPFLGVFFDAIVFFLILRWKNPGFGHF